MPKPKKDKHKELVEIVAEWRRRQGCAVLIEPKASFFATGEIPDVISYHPETRQSYVDEIKITLANWKAQKRKHLSLGEFWTFATPPSLLSVGNLADGWGLVEVRQGEVIEVMPPDSQVLGHNAIRKERHLLGQALLACQREGLIRDDRSDESDWQRFLGAVEPYVRVNGDCPLKYVVASLSDLLPSGMTYPTARGKLKKAIERGNLPSLTLNTGRSPYTIERR